MVNNMPSGLTVSRSVTVYPVVRKENLVGEASVYETFDARHPFLPGQRCRGRHSPECMVHAERVSALGETDEVIHIVGVVAVTDRYSCGTHTLCFENFRLPDPAAEA